MYDESPMNGESVTTEQVMPTPRSDDRYVRVQSLLDAIDSREALAIASLPKTRNSLGWADIAPDSGLSEAQELFIDYWSPRRVIEQCHAERSAITVAWQWAGALPRNFENRFLDELLDVWEARSVN